MEVKCMGIGNGHAEAERISADPGDRHLEENPERETESEPAHTKLWALREAFPT